ncbi:MAG: hypothetical protein ACLFVY_03515 [Phycisphaerae bacterium]
MATRGKKGSVLLPDTAGLNFGIWLDPSADVQTTRPRAVPIAQDASNAPETSLVQTMEEVRKDWENHLYPQQAGRNK